jgi:hypothetical protein
MERSLNRAQKNSGKCHNLTSGSFGASVVVRGGVENHVKGMLSWEENIASITTTRFVNK